MNRGYVKKKLSYVNVHGVISVLPDGTGRMMQHVCLFPNGLPQDTYSLASDGILFPKKRRGEKFIVKYTQMHEKEF